MTGRADALVHLRPQLRVPDVAVVHDVAAGLVQVEPERALLLQQHHAILPCVPIDLVLLATVAPGNDAALLEVREDPIRVGAPPVADQQRLGLNLIKNVIESFEPALVHSVRNVSLSVDDAASAHLQQLRRLDRSGARRNLRVIDLHKEFFFHALVLRADRWR